MKKNLAILITILVILFATGSAIYYMQKDHNQTEIRAAIDIGSGATKLKVAEVDVRVNKIAKVIFEQEIAVPYQRELEHSADHIFPKEILEQGVHSIEVLKQAALDHRAKKVVAVATAAFRKARNAEDFVLKVHDQTGVEIHIINQNLEGILAFNAVLSKTTTPEDQILVWDVGGGSLQLTVIHSEEGYFVGKGTTASNPFKRDVIAHIQNKDPNEVKTPNPLTAEDMQKAIQHAEELAKAATDPHIKDRISDPKTVVYGVGSLFYIGIRKTINDSTATQENLSAALTKFENKNDEQVGEGDKGHADVRVTNALLILGYMKALNIKKVHIMDINIADGAMTYPEFWEGPK